MLNLNIGLTKSKTKTVPVSTPEQRAYLRTLELATSRASNLPPTIRSIVQILRSLPTTDVAPFVNSIRDVIQNYDAFLDEETNKSI